MCVLALSHSGNVHSKTLQFPISHYDFFKSLILSADSSASSTMKGSFVWEGKQEAPRKYELLIQTAPSKAVVWLKGKENISFWYFEPKSYIAKSKSHKATFWVPMENPPEDTVEGFFLTTFRGFLTQNFDPTRYSEENFHFTRALVAPYEHLVLSPKTSDYNFEKIEFRYNKKRQCDTVWAYSKDRSLKWIFSISEYKIGSAKTLSVSDLEKNIPEF